MSAYFNYKIQEFLIEVSPGDFKDFSQTVASIEYIEDILSPVVYVNLVLLNTSGAISNLRLRGGERVRLNITQDATGKKITFDETNKVFYISRIGGSTTQATKELLFVELVPREVFTNETARVFRRYDQTIDKTVTKILKEELRTTRFTSENINPTVNSYSFMGNARKPFTVLTWLLPKGIPQTPAGSSGTEKGTAGYLFYENINGYNYKSVDALFFPGRRVAEKYFYSETTLRPADPRSNFKILNTPVFKKNVDVLDNLRIGMYSSLNYFLDFNTRKFFVNRYKLSDSYNIMNHASSKDTTPVIPNGLQDSPSRLMVKMLDSGQMNKQGKLETADNRMKYQAQSVTRYNLLFSQSLNITVPLNLKLAVGDIIELEFANITKEESKQGLKDSSKSGRYLISKLKHSLEGVKGLTGLELIRDSYGVSKK
jgi:hypothetical protein